MAGFETEHDPHKRKIRAEEGAAALAAVIGYAWGLELRGYINA
jgi:hypothetical protein